MSDEAPETVEGTVKSVVYHNDENGYTVLRVELPSEFELAAKPEAMVVGKARAVWEGEEVKAEGHWVTDKVHGRQFKADKLECVAPRSLKGVEKYLASGLIKGVGPVLAKRIVDTFGEQTMHVLQYQSARLREVPKLGRAKIEKIRASWKQNETLRENMIFGQTYGISIAKMTKIVKRYGPDAIAIIKADPYRLCRDIWGIGFTTADKIALSVGIPKDSPLRARASISYTLETEAEDCGHCWTFENDLLLHANEITGIPTETLSSALSEEVAACRVVCEGGGVDAAGAPLPRKVYLRSLHRAEREVAERVRAISSAPRTFAAFDAQRAIEWWQTRRGFVLAERQREALEKSLSSKFSIITGGPGVGKTTIVRALVETYGAVRGNAAGPRGKVKVVLAAPTGRAAKRMTESIFGEQGPPSSGPNAAKEAVTIHRLLKWNPATNKFTFDADNRLDGDVFIFDETSMIDIRLASDLLKAVPDSATVVWVGDTDQLPSVGPGSVLGDLIKSGVVPSTRLDLIFRQDEAGLIVKNAHHVNAGEPIEVRSGESDFYFVRCEDPATCLKRVIELVTERIPRKFGMDPMHDVQVLSPMRRNVLGTDNLNVELQRALNPKGDSITRGGTTFRVGDRVMQLRNSYDRDVFNGDVGFVKAVNYDDRSLIVAFDGRPVKYGPGELDELVLAYATTIHKSQGSEYPAVVVVLHSQHYMMLQRNLLYTAITRGRRLALLIGVPYAVNRAIQTNTVAERRTSLADRLAASLGNPEQKGVS
ncbi:MAG: ATP-dependent RecD-like DNA helicase [Kiritimatiellae bacterium]|nr:ATP-dependent RecD-like DNA helicase [Kiritimatiellia bacterium]